MSQNPRGKIDVAAIISALEAHVIGGEKMTATQVSAAIALLRNSFAAEDTPHENALDELE